MDQSMGFFQRLALAFSVLFNAALAATVARASQGALPAGSGTPALPEKPKADRRDALHVLSVLQRDGRLIDFLQEDIASFSDAEVGAAARAVHEGCRKVMQSYLVLEPVYSDPEGASVTVKAGFDPASVRLTGNVVGAPPFTGSLRHHGWRAKEVKLPLPPEGADGSVLAPAEVELP